MRLARAEIELEDDRPLVRGLAGLAVPKPLVALQATCRCALDALPAVPVRVKKERTSELRLTSAKSERSPLVLCHHCLPFERAVPHT